MGKLLVGYGYYPQLNGVIYLFIQLNYFMKKQPATYGIILLFVLFSGNPTRANRPPEAFWRAGQLTFRDGTTVEGNLSYNWLAGLVQLRQVNGRVSTFSPDQVSRFAWFDYSEHKFRNFATYTGPDPAQTFFEVYMDGPLSVVRRLKHPRRLSTTLFGQPVHYTDRPTLSADLDSFDYFVYDGVEFMPLNRFLTDIYAIHLVAFQHELRQYVQTHNVNDRSLLGRLILINRYNFLLLQKGEIASARRDGKRPD